MTVSHGLPVTDTTRLLVDFSRPTPPFGDYGGTGARWIFTRVWYPAVRGPQPYPLVIFAPGFGVGPDNYAPLLARIASAGYVVAAPLYPILSGYPAGPSDVIDWDQKFPDTWFVTDSIIGLAESSDATFGGLIDTSRIAIAGHSDGGLIAFGDTYNLALLDARVRAVVVYGAQVGTGYVANGRPMLHFASDGDEYNDFGATLWWDSNYFTDRRWTVALWGANHASPFMDPRDPHFGLVANVTVDFFDQELKGASGAPLYLEVAWSPALAAFR